MTNEKPTPAMPSMSVHFLVYLLCKIDDSNDIPFVRSATDRGELVPITAVRYVPTWFDREGRLVEGTLSEAKRRKSGGMTLVVE